MKTYPIRNVTELRRAFWEQYSSSQMRAAKRTKKRQNDYPADIRMAFCDCVESLSRDGSISPKLAQSAIL